MKRFFETFMLLLIAVIWFFAGWGVRDTLGPVPDQSYGQVAEFSDGSSLFYCQPRGGWCESKTEDWASLAHQPASKPLGPAHSSASGSSRRHRKPSTTEFNMKRATLIALLILNVVLYVLAFVKVFDNCGCDLMTDTYRSRCTCKNKECGEQCCKSPKGKPDAR